MGMIEDHQSNSFTKLLLIGESGTGKTGSLISLVEAGYSLHILDLDNGLDILVNLLKAHPKWNELKSKVDYFTITDKFKKVGEKAVPVNADAWARALAKLTNWSNKADTIKGLDASGKPANLPMPADKVVDLGDPAKWGPNHVLVIDSLTFLCNAAMRYILKVNNRPAGPVYESDWNEAQGQIKDVLALVYDVSFETNVVMMAHIDYQYEGEAKNRVLTRVVPQALGKKLGPQVGRYFNSMLEVRRSGIGAGVVRKIHTVPAGMLELKNPSPGKVKPEYPINTGLAEFFKAVRGN